METITRNILLSLALVAVSSFIPIIGIIAGLFTPYPLLRTIVSVNFRASLYVALPSLLFLVAINPLGGGLYVFETVFPSLVAGYLLLSRTNPLEIVVKSTLAAGALLMGGYVVYMVMSGSHPVQVFFQEMAQVVVDSGASVMLAGGNINQVFAVLANISFGFVMAGISFSLICSLGLLLRRQKAAKNSDDSFAIDRFVGTRIPFEIVFLFLASLVGTMGENTALTMVASSILFYLLMLYAFQGVLILSTFFRVRSVPKPFQFVVYIFMIIQPGLILVLSFFGLLESWFDFRRKWLKLP
ncbi:DUF2232 domain-containing protein [Chrysiogenes arsenatis]|uniref:DUF2232 domain-containing protein n=1 Tax=Chrysiogenes arsenatis TaxID=309797 RepID=UPI000411CD17|nr:DUF2232 domain-containing protein [Chrysiogenes arsenatis]